MKKKVFLAILVMGMTVFTACSAQAEAAEETQTEVKEPEGFGTRLVSVDNVEKYIKLAQYKGLVMEDPLQEVTEERVDQAIAYYLQNAMEEVTDSKSAVQNGDRVTIDFVGTKDGVAFEGGSAEGYELTIGEGGMIDGFEDGIIGMKKGETRDLDLTFPETYFEESLAGQAVVFQITLQKFQRAPELTDAWVEANTDVKTVDEYRAMIKEQLEEMAEQEAEYTIEMNAWNMVFTNSEVVEYPEADIQNAKDEFEKQVMAYAGDTTMTLEEFVESQGLSMDDFNEQCQQYAESKVKQNLITQGIMDAEGMSLDDAECLAIQEELISQYGMTDLAQLVDAYGQTQVDEAIGFRRVLKFMMENIQLETIQVDVDAEEENE